MTKTELEALAGTVTQEAYEQINFVYTFHPAISETNGKQQIADLYKTFGMRIISDMYPTACKAQALEEDIRKKGVELDSLRESLANLRNPVIG